MGRLSTTECTYLRTYLPVYGCKSSWHSTPALHRSTGALAPLTTTPWRKAIGFSQTTAY